MFPGLSPYIASKHGVNGFTKNAVLEYAKQGIRANSICPGGIDTRMLDSLAEQATGGSMATSEMMAPLHPIGRIGTSDEVSNLIVWLCSPRAPFATGVHVPNRRRICRPIDYRPSNRSLKARFVSPQAACTASSETPAGGNRHEAHTRRYGP